MTVLGKGREVSVDFPTETVRGDGVTLTPGDGGPGRTAFAVTDGSGGAPLGHLELWAPGDDGVTGVAWRFAPPAEARAAAALVAVSDWAFGHGARRVEALLEIADADAQRVAMAAGYVREGLRRGMPVGADHHDLVPFARLPGDFRGPVTRLLPDLPGGALSDGVVTLSPLTEADAAETYRLRIQPDVVDTSVPPFPPSAEDVQDRCAAAPAEWLAGAAAVLTVRDMVTGTYVGEITLRYQAPDLGQAMLGYGLLPAGRGKGYATRAVALVARWAFEHTGIERLTAGTWVVNEPSQRVLARAGFRREGLQRALLPAPDGTRRDNIEFALVRTDLPDPPDPASPE